MPENVRKVRRAVCMVELCRITLLTLNQQCRPETPLLNCEVWPEESNRISSAWLVVTGRHISLTSFPLHSCWTAIDLQVPETHKFGAFMQHGDVRLSSEEKNVSSLAHKLSNLQAARLQDQVLPTSDRRTEVWNGMMNHVQPSEITEALRKSLNAVARCSIRFI